MIARFTLLLLTLLSLQALPARAQHPRLILIEEGTNASCDPCARQGPIFEEFLEKPDVAPYVTTLVYHAFWPGPDTMNRRAPAMNDARIRGYYAMIGMPTALVNGLYYRSATSGLAGSVPADTVALRRLVDSLRGLTSPIAITLTDAIEGDRLVVATTVGAADSVAATLRLAVVERHHYYPYPTAGTNGEEHFPWIVRAMLPTHAGRALALAPGESPSFADTIAIDPEWHRTELYVVAFVQDDSTHEVLQAASTREHLTIAERSAARSVADDTTPFASTTSVTATHTARFVLDVERELPPGWSVTVSLAGATVDAGDSVELVGSLATALEVTITPAAGSGGRGTVRVSLTGERGATDTVEYRLYAGKVGIPIFEWYSRFTPQVGPLVASALDRTRHEYVLIPREDTGLFTMSDHDVVVVLAGDDTLDAAQRLLLRRYLDDRGRLLISGSQIAQSLGDLEYDETGIPRDTAFLHNYLHATYVAPTSASLAVNGVRNDPIAANIGFVLSAARGTPGTPDRIRPRRHALPVFHYGSSRDSIGALRYGRAEHRVLYIAFGVEAIADTAQRSSVLGRGIDWLLGSEITSGIVDLRGDGIPDDGPPDEDNRDDANARAARPRLSIVPNPARSLATIDLTTRGRATVRVLDILGRERVSLVVEPGARRIAVDVTSLDAGIYLVTVDDGARHGFARLVVE